MDRNGLIARSHRPRVAIMRARQIRRRQPIDSRHRSHARATRPRVGRHSDGTAGILVDRRGRGAAAACLRNIVDQQRSHTGGRIVEVVDHQVKIGVVGDGNVGIAPQYRDAAVAGVHHMPGQAHESATHLHRSDADLPRRHVEINDEIGVGRAVELLHPRRAGPDQLVDLGRRRAADRQAVAGPPALDDTVHVNEVGVDGDPVAIQIDRRGRLRQHGVDLSRRRRNHAACPHLGMRIGVGIVGAVGRAVPVGVGRRADRIGGHTGDADGTGCRNHNRMSLQRRTDVDVATAAGSLRYRDRTVQIVDPAAAVIGTGHRDIRPRQIGAARQRIIGVDIERIADHDRRQNRTRSPRHVRQIKRSIPDHDTR